jgi:hypothetical protein
VQAYTITKNASYLEEGLAWCDTFVRLQMPLETSTGKQGGYWDTGYEEVYIADTGTAVAALALCHNIRPTAAYAAALASYTLFVTEGCKTAPTTPHVGTTQCPPTGRGWVNPDGSLGDGYFLSELILKGLFFLSARPNSFQVGWRDCVVTVWRCSIRVRDFV